MELKRISRQTGRLAGPLLIVPYGIETPILCELTRNLHCLLIVPYGIETTTVEFIIVETRTSFNRTLWN